jgi:tetratricopeptide (TPR) repeat protein
VLGVRHELTVGMISAARPRWLRVPFAVVSWLVGAQVAAVGSAPAAAGDAFLEGRRLAAAGRCKEALPHLDRALRLDPGHARAYSDRGRCWAILGEPARGLQDLDRAVQAAPRDMSPYFQRAGLRADAGDAAGALADLDRSIQLDPLNAAARAARAGLQERLGHAREAKLDAESAYRQVETFMSRKRAVVDQVLEAWRAKSVRASPRPVVAASDPLKAAREALAAGAPRDAIAHLDAALARRPRDEAALALRGRVHLGIGQAALAVEDLTTVLERHPDAHGFLERGLAYRQLCRFREELADYDRAVSRAPRFARAYFERAFTTIWFDKRRDPIPDLTRTVELDPDHWLAYNLRGEVNRFWSKLAPAMADYERVVRLKPDFAQAYCNMAFALREARRMKEVDAWLRRCYALDPSERRVAERVFAKIQAREEQAARELAAMREWWGSQRDGFEEFQDTRRSRAAHRGECEALSGTWAGAFGCR